MIAIIDYVAGNVKSVENAVKKLGYETLITSNPEEIGNAEKVIFPGVGEASTAMNYLRLKKLDELIPTLKQPFLGICLGQQLLCDFSEEGNAKCLGIFNLKVKKFPSTDIAPHTGWNNLQKMNGPLLEGISETDTFYFVHSYYCEIGENTTSECDYILPFSATLQKDNFYGTQFHPEKSGDVGSLVLQNFLKL
ncbi:MULTISPECIES: imidazole glycerol phosphate synthase subunit HisH [unclassified Kaistella]|uniref:imidazole glycerol phosphate synthase subunit HisH n=1 Tax=unclassified Kaistella TaxID=2762626 RepID=UPI002734EB26|nr:MULTISPECIES: imidazole glycerol phosphate synthase subunit HisH [unclassified Kaistella]MDP2454775.1 imidazole glycerol phosphate synthase subunit HisH [Kaistella sp. SH11-4b]MDP2457512.1 imidazole glycerol phosphate synthase subunit HisH [Kaistella sp. SH40-3]MDP2460272.1 imidazole glycerol phosphate synthase subunit HisH [Kaistella sp. SH19-2b]